MNWRGKPARHHVHAEDLMAQRSRGRRASDFEPRSTRLEIHPLWVLLLSAMIALTGFLAKSSWTDMVAEVKGVRVDLDKVLNNQTHTDDRMNSIENRQDVADAERAKLKDRVDYIQGYTAGRIQMSKQLGRRDSGAH